MHSFNSFFMQLFFFLASFQICAHFRWNWYFNDFVCIWKINSLPAIESHNSLSAKSSPAHRTLFEYSLSFFTGPRGEFSFEIALQSYFPNTIFTMKNRIYLRRGYVLFIRFCTLNEHPTSCESINKLQVDIPGTKNWQQLRIAHNFSHAHGTVCDHTGVCQPTGVQNGLYVCLTA